MAGPMPVMTGFPQQQGMSVGGPSASLYVGDLNPDVTEPDLHEVFCVIGNISNIRLCRDTLTRRSLGYAYVNYAQSDDAERALNNLNYTPIKGRPCRIMWSHRDPSLRKRGVGNIFIKNLSDHIDNKLLFETFSVYGNILSCKVAMDQSGKSKGYGFVHFETQEAADKAINELNGSVMEDQRVTITHWKSQRERTKQNESVFTNLYIKNLPASVDDEMLKEMFARFGPVTSVRVMAKEDGTSRGFGFVNFENPEDARKAVEEMHDTTLDDKQLYVGRAQKRAERRQILSQQFQHTQRDSTSANLYIKNFDDDVDDEKLHNMFRQFGSITSHRVMRDSEGNSRGFGFVCFSSPEEATRAIQALNGTMTESKKPLYVAMAQKKDARRALLEAQFMHRGAFAPYPQMGGMPQGPGGMFPAYFYNQMPPQQYGFAGPQPMMGRGASMMPRWMPQGTGDMYNQGNPPMGFGGPNAGQPGRGGGQRSRGGGRGRGRGGHQNASYRLNQQTRNREQQQPQGQGQPANMGMAQPQHMGMPPHAMDQVDLSTTLANTTPEQRRVIMGERLYPLVEDICMPKEFAPKVTGMLLQMEVPEVLLLLESPSDLQARVQEALNLINTPPQGQGQGQGEGVAGQGEN